MCVVFQICLGRSHVPVGPLTPEQELLALAASEVDRVGERGGEVGAGEEREREGAAGHGEGGGAPQSMGLSGVVSRSEATVRAFSGRGQTLGSRHESVSILYQSQISFQSVCVFVTLCRKHRIHNTEMCVYIPLFCVAFSSELEAHA